MCQPNENKPPIPRNDWSIFQLWGEKQIWCAHHSLFTADKIHIVFAFICIAFEYKSRIAIQVDFNKKKIKKSEFSLCILYSLVNAQNEFWEKISHTLVRHIVKLISTFGLPPSSPRVFICNGREREPARRGWWGIERWQERRRSSFLAPTKHF